MKRGYVPRHLGAGINSHLQTMCVGPFLKLEHASVARTFAFGRLTASDPTIAFAYCNNGRLELIRQNTGFDAVHRAAMAGDRTDPVRLLPQLDSIA